MLLIAMTGTALCAWLTMQLPAQDYSLRRRAGSTCCKHARSKAAESSRILLRSLGILCALGADTSHAQVHALHTQLGVCRCILQR